MSIITLLTDFGTDSPYAAVMKGVILSINPSVTLVDITHAVPPQNIRHGAFVLSQVCRRFPAGTIHVAVVDPGVGTERALIYLETFQQRFVGPDNGLFSRITRGGGAPKVHVLAERDYWLPVISPTFHGRDIMAPVAARLSLGLDPALLGPRHDSMVELDWPEPAVAPRRIVGEVQVIDSFGNLITNITAEHLRHLETDANPIVTCGQTTIAGIVRTYGDRAAGAGVALVGSTGYLELAVVDGSAAERLGLSVGAQVRIDW